MTNLRKAGEQALEALRGYRREMSCHQPCDAEVALEAALEQPEQEPVAWMRPDETLCVVREVAEDEGYQPLYTRPPSREWQVLTDEEIKTAVGASEASRAYNALWRVTKDEGEEP